MWDLDHIGWTPVDALLLSTTSGPFRVLLVALKQCLVGKTLIATQFGFQSNSFSFGDKGLKQPE